MKSHTATPLGVRCLVVCFFAMLPAAVRGELTLAIELSPATMRPGAPVAPALGPELDVRLSVANHGAVTLSKVSIVVPLTTDLLTVASFGILGGRCNSLVGNAGNCNSPESITFDIGDLPPGSGRTVGFSAFVGDLTEGTVVTIAAEAKATGETVNAQESITVRPSPAFELSLSADHEPAGAGDVLEYRLKWGHVAVARLAPATTLSLELPAGTTFISASDGGVLDGGAARWTLGDLDPGDSGERRVKVSLDNGLTEGSFLVARAEIADAATPQEKTSDREVTRIENDTPLQLVLEMGNDPLRSGFLVPNVLGRTVDARLTVTNRGAVVLPAVLVEAPLPVRFSTATRPAILGGSCDNIVGNVNSCDFPERASFTIGDLQPGEGRTVGFSVFAAELPNGSVVRFDAFAFSAAANAQAASEASVVAKAAPDYELALSADHEPIGAGENLTYTLTWGLVAPARLAPGATILFDIPADAAFVSATDGGVHQGSTPKGGTVRWDLGNLAPGDSGERRVTVSVDGALREGAILEARAEIADTAAPLESARDREVTRVENLVPLQLALDLGPDPEPVGQATPATLGRAIDVQLTVTNRGAVVLPAVAVEAPLPARLSTVSRLGIVGGSCDNIVGNINGCDFPERAVFAIGDLQPGQGRTMGFYVFASDLPDASILSLEAFASTVAARAQAAVERSIVVQSAPAFELGLAADYEPIGAGEELTYTLTWGHVAPARVAPATTLFFELPADTTFVSATGGGVLEGASPRGGTVRWELGDLAPNDAGERKVTVSVDGALPEGTLLAARAEIADEAAPPERARDYAVVRVENAEPLTLDLSITPDPVLAGGTLNVALAVRNSGGVELPGVRLEVPLFERIDTLNRLGIINGTCDNIVGNINNCNMPERVIFDLGTLPAGENRNLAFSPQALSGAGAPPDGSLLRFRAFLTSGAHQVVATEDVRIGEEEAPTGVFVRADANSDGRIDIADGVSTLGYLFLGTTAPSCLDTADVDDSSVIDISDGILILSFLFLGSGEPAPPSGAIPQACGADPTPDDGISCLSYPPCSA